MKTFGPTISGVRGSCKAYTARSCRHRNVVKRFVEFSNRFRKDFSTGACENYTEIIPQAGTPTSVPFAIATVAAGEGSGRTESYLFL